MDLNWNGDVFEAEAAERSGESEVLYKLREQKLRELHRTSKRYKYEQWQSREHMLLMVMTPCVKIVL